MFKFLKTKVKDALTKMQKRVDEETPVEESVKKPEISVEKTTPKKEKTVQTIKKTTVKEPQKKGIFGKLKQTLTTTTITAELFNELFEELEIALLENNVAFDVVAIIKQQLEETLVDKPVPKKELTEVITTALHEIILSLFPKETPNIPTLIKNKIEKPYVICFIGVNGSGKTTTVAKLAHYLQQQNLRVLLVAGDTWRAASIQQLEEHGKKLDLKVIKHNYGSDPAAVAFDGIKSAKANNIDVVLIDTAGRQHSNKDLMREMEKINRVAQPDMRIFVGESIAGNDCVLQAQQFGETVPLDGIILTKADVDEKGGAALSVTKVTGKPLLFLGKGQEYNDLEPFDPQELLTSLGL